jgi:hypothetical protein
MAEKDLKALFLHQLKDTYFAENAILKALPQMAEAAESEELRGAFAVHLKETEGQVRRLEQIFEMVGAKPEGHPLQGHSGHHRGGAGDPAGVRGWRGSGCRSDCSRPSGGALRDCPLRHPAGLGQAAWPVGGGGSD